MKTGPDALLHSQGQPGRSIVRQTPVADINSSPASSANRT